jgi:hypothetical protein
MTLYCSRVIRLVVRSALNTPANFSLADLAGRDARGLGSTGAVQARTRPHHSQCMRTDNSRQKAAFARTSQPQSAAKNGIHLLTMAFFQRVFQP